LLQGYLTDTNLGLLDTNLDNAQRQDFTIMKGLLDSINQKTNILELELLLFNEFFKRINFWLKRKNTLEANF
jgi:hypothetical protein